MFERAGREVFIQSDFFESNRLENMKIRKLHTPIVVALMAGHSYGAVILQDTYAPLVPLGAPTDLGGGTFGYNLNLTADFSAAGHGKLIMVLSSKDELGGDLGGAPVTGITYGGVPLAQAMFRDGAGTDRVSVGIFYLDNVVSDGDLRIEFADGNQSEFGFGLYAVDGLKLGVQDVGEGTTEVAATVTLTTSSGFLVHEAARNNQSLTANPDDDWVTLYDFNGPQSYQALSQYQIATAAGDYAAPINNTGTFKYIGAAAFEAVPEPSVALLGGLGLLALLRRRR